ncbi:2-C-methyl-D-erythritol 2,4-cyclodiphosphate synthase [Aminipila butyrica]
MPMETRAGIGYDVHRLEKDRRLILGGVEVPYELGLAGHSDADVLVHAIMDALLGAAALGDIGRHFPDTDQRYKGISSIKLLEEVGQLLEQEGYQVGNIDATLMAQEPKMAPFIPQMKINIAETLKISHNKVNIKATTTEKLGFAGRKEGMASEAVCILNKN